MLAAAAVRCRSLRSLARKAALSSIPAVARSIAPPTRRNPSRKPDRTEKQEAAALRAPASC